MIDEYLFDLNQSNYEDKTWMDEGIDTALRYEDAKKKERKEFDERHILAQRAPRSRF
jgi:hypothetical protein